MPLPRLETLHLLKPEDLPPSRDGLRVIGAFNPAAIAAPTPQHPGRVALLVRVAEQPSAQRAGFHASPRYTPDGGITTDWFAHDAVCTADPRLLVLKDSGFQRLRFTSHLRVCFASDGRAVDSLGPIIEPTHPFDPLGSFGYEDPRLTRLDDAHFFTVVGASEHGVVTELMRTTDFLSFERLGTVFCCENKDVTLFPRRINGAYAAIHRPTGDFGTTPPEMWLATSPDLKHWGDHRPLYGTMRDGFGNDTAVGWDQGRVGGGVPPIETPRGWLVIYHASCKPKAGEKIGVYAAGALLLDRNNPAQVLAATKEPFMVPVEPFECAGFVNAVVFPTGCAVRGDELWLYYGAADSHVGMVRYRFDALLGALAPV